MGYHLFILKSEYAIYLYLNIEGTYMRETLDCDGKGWFTGWGARDYAIDNYFFSKRKAIKKAEELFKKAEQDLKIPKGSYISVEKYIWYLDGSSKTVYKKIK